MRNKIKSIALLVIALTIMAISVQAQAGFDKKSYYAALSSNNASLWNQQLTATETLNTNDKNAFRGALLMRKSAAQKVPAKKLSMFKQGHQLLENAIAKDGQNAEYRFLRLMIQENAPRALGYHKNIAADTKTIKTFYKSFSETTKKAVLSYSKSSKALIGLQ